MKKLMDYKNIVWNTPQGPGAFVKFIHGGIKSIDNNRLTEVYYKLTPRKDRKDILATFRLLKSNEIIDCAGDQISPITFKDLVGYVQVATLNCRSTFFKAISDPARTSLETFLKIAAFLKMPEQDAVKEWGEAETKAQLEKIKKKIQSV